jgi:uncharacterized membrane protein
MEYLVNLPLLSGLLLLAASFIQYRWAPKKINDLYGYRTKASKSSQERWDFAQQYSTRKMCWAGIALSIIGAILTMLDTSYAFMVATGLVLLVISCIYLIVSTERALKNKFEK